MYQYLLTNLYHQILRLRAAISDEEQKLTLRNQNKSTRLRSQRGARSNEKKDIFTEHNKGIKERNERDEIIDERLSKTKSNNYIKASLLTKVRIKLIIYGTQFNRIFYRQSYMNNFQTGNFLLEGIHSLIFTRKIE